MQWRGSSYGFLMDSPVVQLLCSYSICAGHQLHRGDWDEAKNRAVFGKCANRHGHQYRIEVMLSGPLSPDTGMLINGYSVDEIVKEHVTEILDHRFLNDDVDFFTTHLPTAEWIAVWVYETLQGKFPTPVTVKQIRVYETPELAAEYPVKSTPDTV